MAISVCLFVYFCLLGSASGCWCLSLHAAFPSLRAHVHMCCCGTVPVTVCSKVCLCVHKVHTSRQASAPATGQCVRFPVTSSPSASPRKLTSFALSHLSSLGSSLHHSIYSMSQSSLKSHIQKLILLSIHPDACKLLSPKGVNTAVPWSPEDRDLQSVP